LLTTPGNLREGLSKIAYELTHLGRMELADGDVTSFHCDIRQEDYYSGQSVYWGGETGVKDIFITCEMVYIKPILPEREVPAVSSTVAKPERALRD
jgi:hypothetical protein